MRKLLALTVGALALAEPGKRGARTSGMVAGRKNDPCRHFGPARRQHRSPGPRSSRITSPAPKASDHRREQAGRRRRHRGRSGGARGAGRQHAADQQQRHDHQLDPAKGELRSADELRADLLSGLDAADHRRQQRIALPHARGAGRCGARQARRIVDRERRAQHHPAHRDRTVQTAGPGQFDLRAVSRAARPTAMRCSARM